MHPIERPKSLTEVVLNRLRNLIVSGELELGAVLSERQLAAQLKVSKTPVREALAQLRDQGLVTIVPQKGASVFTLSAREVIAMCEFRLAIESSALRLALARNRAGLAEEIDRIVSDMKAARKAGDTRAYLALDTDFHAAFFRHCGNPYLSDSYTRYVGKIAALRTHLAVKPLHTKLSFEEHERLCAAIGEGALDQAEAILADHIGRTRETYAEEIEDIAAADRISDTG